MHAELFNRPTVLARYRAGPTFRGPRALSAVRLRSEGYSRSTLKRIAWVLLIVAAAAHRQGGSVSAVQLETLDQPAHPAEQRAATVGAYGQPDPSFRCGLAAQHRRADACRARAAVGSLGSWMRSPSTCASSVGFRRSPSRRAMSACAGSSPRCRRGFGRSPTSASNISMPIWKARHALAGAAARCMRWVAARSFFRYAAQQGWCGSEHRGRHRSASSLRARRTFQRRRAIEDVGQAARHHCDGQ